MGVSLEWEDGKEHPMVVQPVVMALIRTDALSEDAKYLVGVADKDHPLASATGIDLPGYDHSRKQSQRKTLWGFMNKFGLDDDDLEWRDEVAIFRTVGFYPERDEFRDSTRRVYSAVLRNP